MNYRKYYTWQYPETPEDVAPLLAELKESLVIVGVIGRSKCAQANKMCAFDMEPDVPTSPSDGQIQCYYKPGTNTLLLHFQTTHDEAVMTKLLLQQTSLQFDSFYEQMRCRFVRSMLLALHICHILVYVETSLTFDTSLVTIFQLLKVVWEQQVQEFLPQLLGDDVIGERGRLCAPRMLFLFENYPADEEQTREAISAYEFRTEDCIYELLRQHNIITNNPNSSLLALPNNKQFVFFNAYEQLRPDHLLCAIEQLQQTMLKPDAKEEEEDLEILALAPFEGFVKPYGEFYEAKESEEQLYREQHTIWLFLQRHVQDALDGCFDRGSFKQLSPFTAQCVLMKYENWHKESTSLHQLLLQNAQVEGYSSSNVSYQCYLSSLEKCLNYERKFWSQLSELGLKKGISCYKHAAPAIYGNSMHQQLLADAKLVLEDEGRGPYTEAALLKLSEVCAKFWQDGRQQCEQLSLRGNPCTQPKELPHEKHCSGVVHISSCNCGRTQGRREDPFTLRQANYEYYEHMASMCNLCVKVKKFQFPVFAPSSSEYRAAAFEAAFPSLLQSKGRDEPAATAEEQLQSELNSQQVEEDERKQQQQLEAEEEEKPQHSLNNGCSQPLSATYGSDLNMSIAGFGDSLREGEVEDSTEISSQMCSSLGTQSSTHSSQSNSSGSELVLQLKHDTVIDECCESQAESTEPPAQLNELASTTEYLPGLVHISSGCELLPLFPSWSLACVGPSSIYSHNTGLQEHFQSGFLSGANFLLPWDVHVRLVQPHKQPQQSQQHSTQQQQQLNHKKSQRYRKQGDRVALKIFVGFEYECSRGHRFMMCSPDRVLRGGADIERDTCIKVVNNNMPLYFPCPCRGQSTFLAQLMRIHVVTPKAPVNIILDPKVLVGKYTFTLGCNILPRLSQSAYWILRLPNVYQGDDMLIAPPQKLETDEIMSGGCLLAGMFGIAETDAADGNEAGQLSGLTFTRL
ncbi:nonsense-mediated mRNA decay factor SMG8 [Drosophila nasuta]|uniref:nonsense-mediated mRNA decay factor SMG8 n=1 Tax=Drosophila nasuta TaxID=42062 RepID=UPI00295EC21D|nr:nonsense-mediated mRNA decay factor SMG8 [Drosophila nasuta]